MELIGQEQGRDKKNPTKHRDYLVLGLHSGFWGFGFLPRLGKSFGCTLSAIELVRWVPVEGFEG